ncbi:MAG: endolytic transglycosylase MltG [Proteobacteria bacterium]|nr:endolytic transglycosylase MltG [Pseudomonadota bacterium]
MKFLTLPTARPLVTAVIAGSVLFIVVSLVLLTGFRSLYMPISSQGEASIFEVSAGSSLSRVAMELASEGVIQGPQLFKLLALWRGVDQQIKVGEYRLESGISPAELLTKMVVGDTIQYRVTLVEGWTFRQALQAIGRSEKIDARLQSATDQELAALLEIDRPSPEGQLFPDTYFYSAGTTDVEILRRAHRRLQQMLASAWESRLGALPYDNAYEALILASIIEKESALGTERGHISGVFIRRLESSMRLQSDPTVIYGLGENYTGNLSRADLAATTAYNTYRIEGLPPTPIALAGMESINASLNPLPSEYLYFVARGDGSHEFSSSLAEHNDAVNRYQRQHSTQ